MKKKLKNENKTKIKWNTSISKLEEQLQIYGTFRNKPCCSKCASKLSKVLRVMELSKNKKKYICPKCGNALKAEDFKKYMKKTC